MININELESRHRKYKLKSFIPFSIALFLSIIAITFALSYNFDKNTKIQKDEKISKEPLKKEIKKIKIKEKKVKKIKLKNENKNKITLTPSLNFMKSIQSTTLPYYDNVDGNYFETKTKQNTAVKTNTKIERKTIKNNSIQKKVIKKEVVVKKETSKKISIKRNNDENDIKHVIKRFKTNNNPALSLFVAKKYYKLGNYTKAYNYALITNQINNDIEASWIVFAKSLMKLNKKDKAIKTLKKYIDNSHSSRAKILLDKIQSGKFQ